MRTGKWKFLCEYDGSQPELFDLEVDRGEKNNLAERHPERVQEYAARLIDWHQSLPPDNGPVLGKPKKQKKKN